MTLTPTLTVKGDGIAALAGFTETKSGPTLTIPGGFVGGLIGSLLKKATGIAVVTVSLTPTSISESIRITENLPIVGGSINLPGFSEAITEEEYILLLEFIPNGTVELEGDLTLI